MRAGGEVVWGHVGTCRGNGRGRRITWRGLTWDLSNLDFSALGCPKLLIAGPRRAKPGDQRDEMKVA